MIRNKKMQNLLDDFDAASGELGRAESFYFQLGYAAVGIAAQGSVIRARVRHAEAKTRLEEAIVAVLKRAVV